MATRIPLISVTIYDRDGGLDWSWSASDWFEWYTWKRGQGFSKEEIEQLLLAKFKRGMKSALDSGESKVEPLKQLKPELSLAALTAQRKTSPYLTCDMVDWAVAQIEADAPDSSDIFMLLWDTFENSSPMWRQSHYYLKEFCKKHWLKYGPHQGYDLESDQNYQPDWK